MKRKYLISISIVFLLACTTALIAQDAINAKSEIIIKGKHGSADGQFGLKTFDDQSWAEPTAITIDSKGSIYIADPLNNRIQKFDKAGKFLFKINLDIQKQRFVMTVDDLAVDQLDNVYAISRHEQKIFKYDQNGKLIQTINLKELEIAWDRWRGWRSGGYLQSERISIDIAGNIYLEGQHELIKFDSNGKLVKKWVRENTSRATSYYIDAKGYLYFSKDMNMWERYDQNGSLMGPVICEKEPLLAFTPPGGGQCQFPPKFIDKNGFRYFFELKQSTSDLMAILKVGKNGDFKKYKAPPIIIVGQALNMTKFDADGNLYGYDVDYKKHEYWIVKISLN